MMKFLAKSMHSNFCKETKELLEYWVDRALANLELKSTGDEIPQEVKPANRKN